MFTKTSVRKEGNSLKLESVIYKIQRKTAYNPTRTISSRLERNKSLLATIQLRYGRDARDLPVAVRSLSVRCSKF